MKKIVSILLWFSFMLIKPLFCTLAIVCFLGYTTFSQRFQKRLIIPDSVSQKYPMIKLKSDSNEVWVQNIWLKSTEDSNIVFCEPSTPNSYLLLLSYMPKRRNRIPTFTKFDTTLASTKYNKFNIPISYVYRSILDIVTWERKYIPTYLHPYRHSEHPTYPKNASSNGWGYFLNETPAGYMQNVGACLVELYLFESSKDLRQDLMSLDINKRMFFPKDTVNQFSIEKYTPTGLYKNHIYLHKRDKSGLYYFWIIQDVLLNGCNEWIDGISYDCEDWYLNGYFDIIFDPNIGIIGKTYSKYFYPEKDNTFAPVFMKKDK